MERLELTGGYDPSKFANEDAEEEAPKYTIPSAQPKKEVISRFAHKEGMGRTTYEGDLDAQGQRAAQEASELALLGDMLGGGGGGGGGKTSSSSSADPLSGLTNPSSKDDYTKLGRAIASGYVIEYQGRPGAHYKALMKALVRGMLAPCSVADVRDLEKEVATIKAEKEKEKKDEEAKKAGKKGKGKGAHLKMERDDDVDDGTGGDYIDEYDDFM